MKLSNTQYIATIGVLITIIVILLLSPIISAHNEASCDNVVTTKYSNNNIVKISKFRYLIITDSIVTYVETLNLTNFNISKEIKIPIKR